MVEKAKPKLILIHGAPGRPNDFNYYINNKNLKEKCTMVTIDRHGYGDNLDNPLPQLMPQAEYILKATQDFHPCYLLGYSYGGAVAIQIALLNPTKISGVILIAPTLSPYLEKPRWYNNIASNSFINKFLPRHFKSAQAEIIELEYELAKLEQQNWRSLTMPISFIHGVKDNIVDWKNSIYGINKSTNSLIRMQIVPHQNHNILKSSTELIVNEITHMIN
jgi:pimeloyl-ACP methyl ester carboxylesterase